MEKKGRPTVSLFSNLYERLLILHFRGKAMVERSFAILILWHILPGNDRDIHHPAAAGFPYMGGLLSPVPDPSVMYGQITCADVKPDLPAVGIIVDKVFFAK